MPPVSIEVGCSEGFPHDEAAHVHSTGEICINPVGHKWRKATRGEIEATMAHEITHLIAPGLEHGDEFDEITYGLVRHSRIHN